MAASPNLPDFEELLVTLERLERREREVSAHRARLHDRLQSFPNELTQMQERQLSAERRDLHRRIDLLRAELAPLRRHVDPT
jgi:ABC-type phosphate transport system auxiliary subunit